MLEGTETSTKKNTEGGVETIEAEGLSPHDGFVGKGKRRKGGNGEQILRARAEYVMYHGVGWGGGGRVLNEVGAPQSKRDEVQPGLISGGRAQVERKRGL